MAKRARTTRPPKSREGRANEIKDLVNESVALQVELLGAAVQIWSTMFESMAAYAKAASEELTNLSSRGDANAALDRVIEVARQKLDRIEKLPEEIGRDFSRKVRARAKR
jgi:hypothetical protein